MTPSFRLLTWNVCQRRATGAALALADEVEADVVLLQEARRPSAWTGTVIGDCVPDGTWGSWILTRPGAAVEAIQLPEFSGWLAGTRLVLAGSLTTFVFSLHAPSVLSGRKTSYVKAVRAMVAAIVDGVPADMPLIVGGDFNFLSLGERLPGEPLRETPAEASAFAEFRRLGFRIAWREVRPSAPLPQTLRWSGDRTMPYHCDGFLVRGAAVRIASCDVIDGERWTALSDHSPVALCVDLHPSPPTEP